jgi:hypothetical protein
MRLVLFLHHEDQPQYIIFSGFINPVSGAAPEAFVPIADA